MWLDNWLIISHLLWSTWNPLPSGCCLPGSLSYDLCERWVTFVLGPSPNLLQPVIHAVPPLGTRKCKGDCWRGHSLWVAKRSQDSDLRFLTLLCHEASNSSLLILEKALVYRILPWYLLWNRSMKQFPELCPHHDPDIHTLRWFKLRKFHTKNIVINREQTSCS